jgi:hypothetical protein
MKPKKKYKKYYLYTRKKNLPSFAKEKIHKLIIFPTLWIMIPQMGILREYTTKFMKYPTVA